jgi:benzoyl-CoA reductase subunit D
MSPITTVGIDIGSGAVKTVLFGSGQGGRPQWLAKRCERIRRRDPMTLAEEGFAGVLADAGLRKGDIQYIATTGEGENVRFATGHFYSMTTHARGGVFLDPEARAVVDIGALNGRAIAVDSRGKVLSYKMTSQCASGSGQFLENIARYLGVAVEEIGPLSCASQAPEKVSSICAVLAETDVINMVSRGIATPDILKGIHLSMASRIVKLLKVTGVKHGVALLTGGLALDSGLLAAIQEEMVNEKVQVTARSHADSIYAGAVGAALWGAYRHERLQQLTPGETAAA